MIDLPSLITKFRAVNDRESEAASFHTHVPWIAPDAYLNIIFKPAPPDILSSMGAQMEIPVPVLQLLARHNGAVLFSDSLSVFGAWCARDSCFIDRIRFRFHLSILSSRTEVGLRLIVRNFSRSVDTDSMDRECALIATALAFLYSEERKRSLVLHGQPSMFGFVVRSNVCPRSLMSLAND